VEWWGEVRVLSGEGVGLVDGVGESIWMLLMMTSRLSSCG